MQSSSSPAKEPGSSSSRGGGFLTFILRFQSVFGLIALFVLAVILSPIRNDQNVFLNPSNQLNILRFAAENGIIAIGMTLVILTGGIDLSVGALLALCAVGSAWTLMSVGRGEPPSGWASIPGFLQGPMKGGIGLLHGLPGPGMVIAAVLVVLALGAFAGSLNGLVTTRLGIQSFITTLAMLSVARGVASLWSGGYAIPMAYGANTAPPAFKSLFAGEVNLGFVAIPVQILYFVGVGGLTAWALARTRFGRHIYAVGSSEGASRLSGVPVNRVKVAVFVISGFLSALAALLHTALVNQGSHIDGSGYELNAIAAVVIGGTSLSGGTGTVVGSMVGALILSILDNILGLRNIQSEYQMILKGVIIVIAVVLQRQRR
jgi:ribose transport system permease protein